VGRSQTEEQWVLRAEIDERAVAGQRIMVVTAPDWTSQWALPFVRHLHGLPMPASSELLSAAFEGAHELLRVGPRVLELDILEGAGPMTFAGSVYRPEDAVFHAGDSFDCPHFHVDVLTAARGQPKRMRFTFPWSLDDPRYLFLFPRPAGLARLRLPPVGETLWLPEPAWPSYR
jgi:hypothetical protein